MLRTGEQGITGFGSHRFLFGITLWHTNVSVETLKSTVAHWSP